MLIAVFRINTAYVILLFVVLGIASAAVGSRLNKRTADAGALKDDQKPSDDGTEGGGR